MLFEPLVLPKFKVPAGFGGAADYTPFEWSGKLLLAETARETPIVGSGGLFDFHGALGGPIVPQHFGKQNHLVRMPRVLVIGRDPVLGPDFTVSPSLAADLASAHVDVYDSGFNLTAFEVLGTCCPAHVVTDLVVPQENRPIVTTTFAGLFRPPSPVAFHYFINVLPPLTSAELAALGAAEGNTVEIIVVNFDVEFPDDGPSFGVSALPERYLGGDLLSLSRVARNAYAVVQEHNTFYNGNFFGPEVLPSPVGAASPFVETLTFTVEPKANVITADRALVAAALPRFHKAAWHIFLGPIVDADPAHAAEIRAIMTGSCTGLEGVILHDVGSASPSINPAQGEQIIREFFNL